MFENPFNIEYIKRIKNYCLVYTNTLAINISEMNKKEKEILSENLYDSLPATINLKNLLGNEVFISWFLPRLKLIKEIQRWPHEKIYELTEIRLRNFLTYLNNNSVFWSTR